METAAAEITDEALAQETPAAPEDTAERSVAEHRGTEDLFKYAIFVHIGPGADKCEERESGTCADPHHFHAWCRLPNNFQAASIREKAMAAKARKVRLLRDPESDAAAILDSDMIEVERRLSNEEMIEEILRKNFWRDQVAAMRQVGEQEEFAHIAEDRERHRALSNLPEEDRPTEEYEELLKHLEAYTEAVETARSEEQEPERRALGGKSREELLDMVREERLQAEAVEDFQRVYAMWQAYIGTMKVVPPPATPTERYFDSIDSFQGAAPEVIAVLVQTFRELEGALGTRTALGNS